MWPPPSGELTLAPPLSVPSPPHPFIVNSHFCTGFEPEDVGSHFFFLCLGISGHWRHDPQPGVIWENPKVCPLPAPNPKSFKKISISPRDGLRRASGRELGEV